MDYGSVHSYAKSEDFTLVNCIFLPEVIDETMTGCRSLDELLHGCLIRYYASISGETPVDRIFHDEDGRSYMLLNRGARIMEISEDGKECLSKPQLIWYGWDKHGPEGPHILKKDGWYYCFLAEGGTGMGHKITVARSRQLMGPYEDCPYNPIMTQKDPAAAIQCCGHGKPVSTPDGRWYMVYLCSRYLKSKWGDAGAGNRVWMRSTGLRTAGRW